MAKYLGRMTVGQRGVPFGPGPLQGLQSGTSIVTRWPRGLVQNIRLQTRVPYRLDG